MISPIRSGMAGLAGWQEWWAWVIRTAKTETDKVRAFVEAATRFNEELAGLPARRRQLEGLLTRAQAIEGDARPVLEGAARSLLGELEELEQNGVGLLARVREFLEFSQRAKAGGDELDASLGVLPAAGWVLMGVGAGAAAGGAAITWWLTRNDGGKFKANALGRVVELVEDGKTNAAGAVAMLRAAGIGAGGGAGRAALVSGRGGIAVARWPQVKRHARRLPSGAA